MPARFDLNTLAVAFIVLLGPASPARGDVFAFDASAGGPGYETFDALAEAYREFMGTGNAVIDLNDLSAGETLGDQYRSDHGVVFLDTTSDKHASKTGIHAEGDNTVRDLTGYGGAYMPDGDSVYVKFNNNLLNSPFTIIFDEPVDRVGAFLGMGAQGDTHSLTVSAFDEKDQLFGEFTVDSWLWETKTNQQNHETFFGIRGDGPSISRVEILNDARRNFASALIFDNLEFSGAGSGPAIPETGTAILLMSGVLPWFAGRRFPRPRWGRIRAN